MKCGRVERSWVRSCLAIGLAQGFLEPLEATALHLVLATVGEFLDSWDTGNRDGFNRDVARRYDGIRDYLVCHYRTAGRQDTDYWRDATSNDRLSDSLKGVITAWFTGADLAREVAKQGIGGYYPAMSWHVMLTGYGAFPASDRLRPPNPKAPPIDMAQVERFAGGCALNFPSHRDALADLSKQQAA